MDASRFNAMAHGLGMKRSNIVLPWEQGPLKDILGQKNPLIQPPQWVPEPYSGAVAGLEDQVVSKGHLLGKSSWTTKTTLIPWPVFEESRLSKVLELWRVVILDSYLHLSLGRQIHSLMSSGDDTEEQLKDVVRDALCGKSISTLRTRVSSIASFGRWKKSVSMPEEVSIFPITEELAYKYLCDLRKEGAPCSRASRFLESVAFCKGMLGAEVDDVLNSARVKGACYNSKSQLEPRKKDPFTCEQVEFFECLACSRDDQVGILAGYVCFLIYGRLRWSDGQHCQEEPWLDEGEEFSYLEARLYHHKTAGRTKVAKRLLPVACPVPGVSRWPWASSWLQNRKLHGLEAGVGRPTMPAPTSTGGWSLLPLGPSDAAVWIREVLAEQDMIVQGQSLGTHSAKATLLSWMCKAHAQPDIQRLAGYHVDPNSKSALEYSRDGQAPVVHFLEGLLLAIYSGKFLPDSTRAGRWVGCRSLEQALDLLARRRSTDEGLDAFGTDGASDSEDDWDKSEVHVFKRRRHSAEEVPSDSELGTGLDTDSEVESELDFDDDDDSLEVNGRAVSDILDKAGAPPEQIFRHKVSGIFHIMAESTFADVDGELSATKCGKIISHNFVKVDGSIAFLPTKCKRCFTK